RTKEFTFLETYPSQKIIQQRLSPGVNLSFHNPSLFIFISSQLVPDLTAQIETNVLLQPNERRADLQRSCECKLRNRLAANPTLTLRFPSAFDLLLALLTISMGIALKIMDVIYTGKFFYPTLSLRNTPR